MRNKVSLLIISIISLKSVSALNDRFTRNATNMLGDAMDLLIRLVTTPNIRQGIVLVLFVILMYQIYTAALRHFRHFNDSVKMIAVPLALLSTFGVYKKVRPDVIDSLFLFLGVAVLLIWAYKKIISIANKIRSSNSPRRSIKDQKNIQKDQKENKKMVHDLGDYFKDIDKQIIDEKDAEDNLHDNNNKMSDDSKDMNELIRKMIKELYKTRGDNN